MVLETRGLACAALAGAFALTGSAVGQSGGGSYRFDPTAIANGGGTSSGGSYALSGTFGQAAAATLAAASYVVHDGLWAPAPGGATGDAIFDNGFDP